MLLRTLEVITMNFNKVSAFLLILVFSLCSNLSVLQSQTKSNIICTFTIGSNEVVINNGVEIITKELCLPIGIHSGSNRATLEWEAFQNNIYPHIERTYNVSKKSKESECDIYLTFYTAKTETRQFTMIYPYNKAFFSDGKVFIDYNLLPEKDRITLPFAIYRVDTKKAHFGYTYIMPLRLLFENIGHKVDWNPDTQEITVTYPAPEEKE